MELFEGIDLNDSFILNWGLQQNSLHFDLEASIWPASEFYTKPKDGEYTCYRSATLVFENLESIVGLRSLDSVRATADPGGTIDYGNIDALQRTKNGFSIEGNFGSVKVVGGELKFKIHT